MLLSICIISYNTSNLTQAAIRSCLDDCHRSPILKSQTEIIVVDNNSKDDSIIQIKNITKASSLPLRLIINKKNLGFAKANNQAIQKSKGKYILLLNSDTYVQAYALEKLVNSFEDRPIIEHTSVLSSESKRIDRVGLMAATLLNPDGTHQPQGGSFPSLLSLFFQMTMLDDTPLIGWLLPSIQHTGWRANRLSLNHPGKNPELFKMDWVAGTALMIRKEALKEIGMLDEQIFMYGEDVEWSMRAKAHHWDVVINTQARITHFQTQSSSSEKAILGEFLGLQYIWAKHKPLWQFEVATSIMKLGTNLRRFIYRYIIKRRNLYDIYTLVNQKLKK